MGLFFVFLFGLVGFYLTSLYVQSVIYLREKTGICKNRYQQVKFREKSEIVIGQENCSQCVVLAWALKNAASLRGF